MYYCFSGSILISCRLLCITQQSVTKKQTNTTIDVRRVVITAPLMPYGGINRNAIIIATEHEIIARNNCVLKTRAAVSPYPQKEVEKVMAALTDKITKSL